MQAGDIALILSTVGLAQGLFLLIYLSGLRKGNRQANIFLAVMILGLTLRIAESVAHNFWYLSPALMSFGLSGTFLVGPLLFFYGKKIFNKDWKLKNWDYLQVAPFAIFGSVSFMAPFEEYLPYHGYALVLFHLVLYTAISWYYLQTQWSSAGSTLVSWYKKILIGVSVLCLVYFSILIELIPFYISGAISYSILVYGFSYMFLKRHVFILEKYNQYTLGPVASKHLFESVKRFFEENKAYIQPNVTLDFVAGQLQVNPRELSRAINQNSNQNFSGFVNSYRIKRAKELLTDPHYAREKIATIAYESGFSNVTSFNITFKAAENRTPSEYRKDV